MRIKAFCFMKIMGFTFAVIVISMRFPIDVAQNNALAGVDDLQIFT